MIVNEGGGGKTLPDLTNPGAASDLAQGKQLIGQNGEIVNGSVPVRSASNVTASGATVTVPAGHYPSQVQKSVATATQATPTISVNSNGVITASVKQNAGYTSGGTKTATKNLTVQGGKTVTPGTSQQTAVASGRYTTGNVYVAGDANLKAENIKKDVSIFGVRGTNAGGDPIQEIIDGGLQLDRNDAGTKYIDTMVGAEIVLGMKIIFTDIIQYFYFKFEYNSSEDDERCFEMVYHTGGFSGNSQVKIRMGWNANKERVRFLVLDEDNISGYTLAEANAWVYYRPLD